MVANNLWIWYHVFIQRIKRSDGYFNQSFHDMGTIFEELIRKFNKKSNEKAGENWMPNDVIELMVNFCGLQNLQIILMFLKVRDMLYKRTIYEAEKNQK